VKTSLGWQLIGEFVGQNPVLVFFAPSEDLAIIEFNNGPDLTTAIGESFGSEFCISDHRATYLLCFNHHHYLIGADAAAEWITQVTAQLEATASQPDSSGAPT
jgi:hypothetical protein